MGDQFTQNSEANYAGVGLRQPTGALLDKRRFSAGMEAAAVSRTPRRLAPATLRLTFSICFHVAPPLSLRFGRFMGHLKSMTGTHGAGVTVTRKNCVVGA